MSHKNKPVMQRGYNAVREKLVKAKTYLASCQNCFYFQNGECVNPNVTEYDVTVDGDRVWCSYWEVYRQPTDADVVNETYDRVVGNYLRKEKRELNKILDWKD